MEELLLCKWLVYHYSHLSRMVYCQMNMKAITVHTEIKRLDKAKH